MAKCSSKFCFRFLCA